jgi:hypothetical protein
MPSSNFRGHMGGKVILSVVISIVYRKICMITYNVVTFDMCLMYMPT